MSDRLTLCVFTARCTERDCVMDTVTYVYNSTHNTVSFRKANSIHNTVSSRTQSPSIHLAVHTHRVSLSDI